MSTPTMRDVRTSFVGLVLATLSLLAIGAQAGEARTMYSELTFVRVAAEDDKQFRKRFEDVVVPVLQVQVDGGELWGAALYSAEYGDAVHDYVLIRQSMDFAQLEPPALDDETWETVFRRKNRDTQQRRIAKRADVTSRVIYANTQFHTNLEVRERPWLKLSYLRTYPGEERAFRQLMREVWDPVLAEWVASGSAAAFSTYQVVLPGPGGHEHDQVMVSQYGDFASLRSNGSFFEAFRTVWPDGDLEAELARLRSTGRVIDTETWKLQALVTRTPPPPADDD